LAVLASYSVTDAAGTTYEVSANSESGPEIIEEVDPKTFKKFYWVGRSYRLSIAEP
jgi:hypothetical protein